MTTNAGDIKQIVIGGKSYNIYDENAVRTSTYTTDKTALTTLAKKGIVSATYNDTTHKIEFTDGNGNVVTGSSIDAAPFIRDGMLTNAEIQDTYTFPTDSTGQAYAGPALVLTVKLSDTETKKIAVRIDQIFNSNNYYTKSEVYTTTAFNNAVDARVTEVSGGITLTVLNEKIKATEDKIPTKVSQLTNNSGYITTCFSAYDSTTKTLTLK